MPLNAEAMALVQKQVGKHLTHVFSFRGKSIKLVSTVRVPAAATRAVPASSGYVEIVA